MKHTIITLMLVMCCISAVAQQPVQGTSYYLPKTGLRFALLIEKTTFTPGPYAMYAERYLKAKAPTESSVTYRIISKQLSLFSVPDSSKHYTLLIDKKRSVLTVDLDNHNVLKAINAKAKDYALPAAFRPARKAARPQLRDFMTEDMVNAGSSAKTAELIAQEIYDIRDSRNQLSRGEADNMPKDGAQLKLMFAQLQTQEQTLSEAFMGTQQKDTVEQIVTFVPDKEVNKQLLFRFSAKFGITDNDDLAGIPYYISVTDEHVIPPMSVDVDDKKKKDKEDIGLYVNLPGKIKVQLYKEEKPEEYFEPYAAQFGRIESLSAELFGKKMTTHIVLNPINGNIESMATEPLD